MYKIVITVDENDADYISRTSVVTWEEIMEIIPLIEALKNFQPYNDNQFKVRHRHNYSYDIDIREDLGEKTPQELYNIDKDIFSKFEQYVPHTEGGFHTVESIIIYPMKAEINLFKKDSYPVLL